MLLLPRFPHRTQRPLSTILYHATLGFLSLLVIACLLASLYDVAQQLVGSTRASKVSDVIITFGTYVVIVSTFPRATRTLGVASGTEEGTTGVGGELEGEEELGRGRDG